MVKGEHDLDWQMKEVAPAARKRDARLSFAFVYPDRRGRNVIRNVWYFYFTQSLTFIWSLHVENFVWGIKLTSFWMPGRNDICGFNLKKRGWSPHSCWAQFSGTVVFPMVWFSIVLLCFPMDTCSLFNCGCHVHLVLYGNPFGCQHWNQLQARGIWLWKVAS